MGQGPGAALEEQEREERPRRRGFRERVRRTLERQHWSVGQWLHKYLLAQVLQKWRASWKKPDQESAVVKQRGLPRQGAQDPACRARPERSETRPARRTFSVDADEMKERVREGLLKPAYSVFDFYHKTGIWQKIARSSVFESVTLAVIAINALWISIDLDFNNAEVILQAHPVFQIAENLFCAFFLVEWLVRFMSFRRKRYGMRDRWFVFDSSLVAMMVFETWAVPALILSAGSTSALSLGLGNAGILRVFRLLRLSRMTRMVRLFRAMPELVILFKGMAAAIRSVFFTFCLLFIMLYVFGITFRQLAGSNAVLSSLYFSSVPASMYNLVIHGTFMDSLSTVVKVLGQESIVCSVLFWIFILLSALTVMNMLIGILCEVVSAVSATEKEAILVNEVKEKMQQLFKELDESGDGRVSREEFLHILERPAACRLLQDVGVDVVGLVDQVDAIFTDEYTLHGNAERELDFPDLMELVLSLRGSCAATVKDIIDLRKFIGMVIKANSQSLLRIDARLERLEANTGSPRLLRGGAAATAPAARDPPAPEPGHAAGADGDVQARLAEEIEVLEHKLRDGAAYFKALHEELEAKSTEIRRLSALERRRVRRFGVCPPWRGE